MIWSLFFILSSCTSYQDFDEKVKTLATPNYTLEGNTRISGKTRINGTITVPRGVILRIDPGARIKFTYTDTNGDGIGDGGIIVKGTILADGTPQNPILFVGERSGTKSWSEILIEYSPASSFTYCEFKDAHWGLHVHYSPVTISYCRFIDNYAGIRFRSGPVTIEHSLFQGNTLGIRYIAADPVIKNNIFEMNTSDIFIREGSTNPLITGNNFLDNKGFAIKLGESQKFDIPAPDNFWGSNNLDDIEAVIYDKLDSDYLGRVLYDPVATGPYSRAGPGAM